LKEYLFGFAREEIFTKNGRAKILEITKDQALKSRLDLRPGRPERDGEDARALEEAIEKAAARS